MLPLRRSKSKELKFDCLADFRLNSKIIRNSRKKYGDSDVGDIVMLVIL